MSTIFYLMTIQFIWYELVWITRPFEKTNEVKEFDLLQKQFKGKKWNDFSKEYKSELKSKLWLVLMTLWMFLGLFTSQWIAFLFILVFNFIVIAPLSKLLKYSVGYTILHWFNSIIGFVFGIFIIINHYHLNINLTELFLQYFN